VAGNPARARGLNKEGLKRHAFPDATQKALQEAYRALYRSPGSRDELLEKLGDQARQDAHVRLLLEFLEQHRRGIIR
jgi:UDP-N-acetylglucosamine acyltransferase